MSYFLQGVVILVVCLAIGMVTGLNSAQCF